MTIPLLRTNRQRLRRSAMALIGASIALTLFCTLSLRWWCGWTGRSFSVALGNAGIGFGSGDYRGPEGGFGPAGWTLERLVATSGEPSLYWLIGQWKPNWSVHWDSGDAFVSVPLWPLIAILFIWGACLQLSWHSDRRLGLCQICGYSLTGLPADSPCPECGGKLPQSEGGI